MVRQPAASAAQKLPAVTPSVPEVISNKLDEETHYRVSEWTVVLKIGANRFCEQRFGRLGCGV